MPKNKHQRPTYQLREGRAEEKVYDKYFFSLSKDEQKKMRDAGCGPYREMALPRHSFPVYENSADFGSHDPRKEADKITEETWVTGERVSEIIRDVLAMLGSSTDDAVVHHWELVKIVLQMPDCLTENELANQMGLTKQAISVRAKKILHRASLVSPGILSRVRMRPMPKDRNALKPLPEKAKTPLRNLFKSPKLRRGLSTTGKKRK